MFVASPMNLSQNVLLLSLILLLLPSYMSFLSQSRQAIHGQKTNRIDSNSWNKYMSTIDESRTRSPSTEEESLRDKSPLITYKLVDDEQDVLEAADLCINVFFGKKRNIIHGMILNDLRRKQSFDLLQRLWNRPTDDSMVSAKDNKGNLLGFAETFVWSVDAEIYGPYLGYPANYPLVENNGRIYLPKLANLAVVPSARKMGVGRQLVEACIVQARAWGYDQILLQVDADNKPARAFYRKLGFEELLTDMSEKRYDANGLYLTFVKAPKVLLRKVIN